MRSLFLLVLLLSVLPGCGGGPSETFEVTLPDDAQVLFVTVRLTSSPRLPDFRVQRTVELALGGDGNLRLRPLTVHARGIVNDADGGFVSAHIGVDRAEQAILNPDLAPFWAVAQAGRDAATFGYPTLDDQVQPPGENAYRFHLRSVPDLLLPTLLHTAVGTWALKATREAAFHVRQGPGMEPWSGRVTLNRRSGADWTLMLAVDARWGGPVARGTDTWKIDRRVSGFVILGQDGRVESANLEADTKLRDAQGTLRESARHLVEIRHSSREVTRDQSRAYATLLDLQQRDASAFQARILDDTAAHARRLVGFVRPGVELEGVRIQVWDREFHPDALPEPTRRGIPGVTYAYRLAGHWWPDLASLFGVHIEERVAGGADPSKPSREAGACWTSHDGIAVRPAHVSNLQLLAHELARVADARHAFADLARLGFSEAKPDGAWIDLDGVLAVAALDEATAELTGWATYLDLFQEWQHSHLMDWILSWTPRPGAEDTYGSRLLSAADAASSRLLAGRRRAGDSLTQMLERTWHTFSYQTREVLFPEAASEPSRLWPRARELRSQGAAGATRVGAWHAAHLLALAEGIPLPEATSHVEGLLDDVVLKGRQGVLWVSRWATEEAAEAFTTAIADPATVSRIQRDVVVEVGEVPHRDAWLRVLLAPK